MWKLIVISVLLGSAIIAIGVVTFRHYRKPLFTSSYFLKLSRDLTIPRTYNPYTIVVGSHLFTISSHLKYIEIKSSDWSFKECEILIDSRDKITGKIQAVNLGENIFVWGSDDYDYNLLMIDLWNCGYKPLARYEGFFPKIVATEKSVNVLCPSSRENCVSCRFDEYGNKFDLQHQIFAESRNQTFLTGYNVDKNYVYAFANDDGTSEIKILDHDFDVLKQTSVNFSITDLAVSTLSDNLRYELANNPTKFQIGLLYESPKRQFHIVVFDMNLQPVFTNELLHRDSDEYQAFAAYLTMDSRGNSFVTCVLANETEKYHLVRYDANGHLIVELDIDEYWRRDEPTVTQTFLIIDSEYCLVNHYKAFSDDLFDNTYIKCINVD